MTTAQIAPTARDFAIARDWLGQFGEHETITVREFNGLPPSSPLKSVMGRLNGLSRHEAWVQLNALEADYNQRFSVAAVNRRHGSPLDGAFQVVPGADPNRAQKLQRLNDAVAAAQRGDHARAIPELEEVLPNIFQTDRASRASGRHWLALSYYNARRWPEATQAFRELVAHEPGYPHREEAMLGMILSAANQSPGVDRDRKPTQLAVADCDQFLAAYPGSRYRGQVEQIRARMAGTLAQSDVNVARMHFDNAETFYMGSDDKHRYYTAAAHRAQLVLKDPRYEGTGQDAQALYLLALSYQELGRGEEARLALQRLTRLYPSWEGTRRVAERLRA